MLSPAVIEVIKQRAKMDCGICCLSMILGKTYDDVFEALIATGVKKPGVRGLYLTNLQRAAEHLGAILVKRRKYKLDEDFGILSVGNSKTRHFVVLCGGQIIDPHDGTLWQDPSNYLSSGNFKPLTLLTPSVA